jgi:hypothetical protein
MTTAEIKEWLDVIALAGAVVMIWGFLIVGLWGFWWLYRRER